MVNGRVIGLRVSKKIVLDTMIWAYACILVLGMFRLPHPLETTFYWGKHSVTVLLLFAGLVFVRGGRIPSPTVLGTGIVLLMWESATLLWSPRLEDSSFVLASHCVLMGLILYVLPSTYGIARISGFVKAYLCGIIAASLVSVLASWYSGSLLFRVGNRVRLTWSFQNPNYGGLCGLIMFAGSFYDQSILTSKLLQHVARTLGLLLILTAGSRAAIVAAAALVLIRSILELYIRRDRGAPSITILTLILVTVFALLILAPLLKGRGDPWEIMNEISSQRLKKWSNMLGNMNWLSLATGNGLSSSATGRNENFYLDFLYQTGLIGLLLYCIFVFSLLIKVLTSAYVSRDFNMGTALSIAAAALVYSFFETPLWSSGSPLSLIVWGPLGIYSAARLSSVRKHVLEEQIDANRN